MTRNNLIVIMLLLGSIVMAPTSSVNSEGGSEIAVEVMIDFGNGIVEWTEVSLNANHTALKATENACEQLNLDLTVEWYPFGALVMGIGGIVTPQDWSWSWWLFLWNDTQQVWEDSPLGASSLELGEGDIIGWGQWGSKPMTAPNTNYVWLGFRHDALNLGHTKGNDPSTNAVSWVYDTGTVEMAASPAIALNNVIVNNWGGVYCLNEEGELVWENVDVLGGFSPAVANEMVFVGGKDGYLHCLNLTNGNVMWSTMITSNPGLSGVTSSPTFDKGRVYVGAFNFSGGPGALFCLDENDGGVLWESTTSSSVYFSSPCVTKDKVYVGTMGLYNSSTLRWKQPYGLYCFNKANGEELWYFPANGSVGSSPTINDDKVLFTSKDGYLYSLDATDGALIWKKNIGSSVSSPAVWEDTIFVGSGEMNGQGKFYSFDMEGNKLSEFEPNGAVQSSPAVAGNHVYFATNVENGTIYCLNHSNGQLELVWQFMPRPKQYIISSPAIADGKLFIASDNGRLYCFGGGSLNITVDNIGSSEIVHAGEHVNFFHKEQENRLIITNIEANKVTLEMGYPPKTVEVNVGGTKNLDTDGNGKKDLSITVNSVDTSSQYASLTLKALAEPQDEGISLVLIPVLVIIIIVIILIAVGITVNLRRRR